MPIGAQLSWNPVWESDNWYLNGWFCFNIAVFASHGGSDLQAIIDGCKNELVNAKVTVVISNNSDSLALNRAKNEDIPSYHLSVKKYGNEEKLAKEILKVLSEYDVDIIFWLVIWGCCMHRLLKSFKIESLIFTLHCSLNMAEKACTAWMFIMLWLRDMKPKQE